MGSAGTAGGRLGVAVSPAGDQQGQRQGQEQPEVRRFRVGPGTRLRLSDLPGPAQVSRGGAGEVTVRVLGADQVRVEQTGGAVEVSGPRSSGGNVVTNGVTIGGGGGHNFGTVIGNVGGRVVVDGVDVTEAVRAGGRGAGGGAGQVEPARVEVTVPAGTPVEVDDCARTQVYDVSGPVQVDLTARGATEARVDLSGQCVVRLLGGTGHIGVDVSGQCRTEVDGDHDELQADISGQSSVQATGRYGHVRGRVSGMSTVAVTGQVGSHRLRTDGMSTATVNGREVGR
jgi:hypothetical protein